MVTLDAPIVLTALLVRHLSGSLRQTIVVVRSCCHETSLHRRGHSELELGQNVNFVRLGEGLARSIRLRLVVLHRLSAT